MDTLTLIIILAVAGLVVLVGGGLTLLRRRPRKAPLPPLTEPTTEPVLTPTGDVTVLAPPTPVEPGVEKPEPVAGRLSRLRARLGSQRSLGRGLLGLLSRDRLDEETWEEVEEVLLTADVGVAPTQELVERLRTRAKDLGDRDPEQVRALLREELLTLVGTDVDRSLHTAGTDGRPAVVLVVGVNGTGKTTTVGKLARVIVAEGRTVLLGAADTFRAAAADQLQTWGERVGAPVVRGAEGGDPASVAFDSVKQAQDGGYDVVVVDTAGADGRPAVVLVVGVNGTGKTTTVGKLARVIVAEGRTVLLGAADTFRAAAADQLQTWGERVGAPVVRGAEGGDPASVAFDSVKQAQDGGYDVVVVDTAGRLQNKVGLMDELGKVKRVVEKHGPVDEVLLVLDATTGQNGLVQARVFSEVVDVTGIVLTKLDGTAKGGIVVAVQRELGVPVKLVGLGEGPDDLAPFEPEAFIDALLD